MESGSTQSTTKYQPVTVDVPEARVAEFHAVFAGFLAGPGRKRRGRHGSPHGGPHGRRCRGRHGAAERYQATGQPSDVSEV